MRKYAFKTILEVDFPVEKLWYISPFPGGCETAGVIAEDAVVHVD